MKRSFHLNQRAGFREDKSGAAAVEFAFVGLALIFLLFGVVECGRMLWTQNALQYAVEQAARCAIVNTTTSPKCPATCSTCPTACGTTTQIQSYAACMAYGLTLSSSVFSVTTPSNSSCVSASLPYATGLPVSISVTLTAQSCRPS
jgi:Flp pilus assembly protein TadG